ncbi:serine/threonine protein phosphatase [Auriculariales sp. MPI-PUGE-AT-0066]|nr:serine/threonine protein phosphatase [Auriculariales sp. MPI-PUGE-AT-0066]
MSARPLPVYDPPPMAEGWTVPEDNIQVQVMSDLHLERKFHIPGQFAENGLPVVALDGYESFDFPVVAPNLALLGDIGRAEHDRLFVFLRFQLKRFRRIFFVVGNHELYDSSSTKAMVILEEFEKKMTIERLRNLQLGEFVLMHRKRYDLSPSVTILGCTLWSHIPAHAEIELRAKLGDFLNIENWTPGARNAAHDLDRLWIARELEALRTHSPQRRVLLLTHHAPTQPGTSEPRFEDDVGRLLNFGFASALHESAWWGPPISTWCFGHTHFNCDFVRQGVRLVSNQRGYDNADADRIGFQPAKVVSI